MKTSFLWALLLVLAFSPDSWAAPKKKKHAEPTPEHKVYAVNGASITLTIGTSGEQHQTFKITSDTKVTLDGVPIPAHDLRAGMVVRITPGADKTTAESIEAKDAPRHPAKRRVG
jgi:hypothetical protein